MKKTVLMLFISVLFGCSKDLEPPLDNSGTAQIENTKSVSDLIESKFGEPMVLGEKIDNPYSVKSLKKMRSAVVPTHYYVRFLPENKQEYGFLLKSIRCFPFPLDRKIIEGGSFYRDPDPANVGKPFSWQYAVVPVQQTLPDVQYEILDELCIPEDPDEQIMTRGAGGTGGGPIGPPGSPLHKVVVRVWDNLLNQFIPLQGLGVNVINVAAGQSLTYGITDATGTAVMSRYFTVTKDIFYSIFWSDGKEGKWFLSDGNNNQLFYNVKAVAGVTNIDIKSSSTNVVVEQLLGTIHRAAYRTYYKQNSDLLKPVHEDFIQVAYLDKNHADYAGVYYSYPPYSSYPNIEIYGRSSSGALKPTKNIFSTTVHEFAHLNHDVNSGRRTNVFGFSERIISESWARAVQKLLTNLEYAFYGYSFYRTETLLYRDPEGVPGPPGMRDFVVPNDFNFQKWPFSEGANLTTPRAQLFLPYSPIFIDLMDNENQRDYFFALTMKDNYDYKYANYPNDNVKDFTISELQNLLKTVNSIEELRDKVKTLPNLHGNPKGVIDNLFVKYIEYWRKYHPITKGESGCTPGNGGCIIYD